MNSKFLEIPETALTPICFFLDAHAYILRQFCPDMRFVGLPDKLAGNEEQLIQSMIDNSDHKLRMYGSAKELLNNINIYRKFPGAHRYFVTDEELYQTPPTIFYSSKNEKFISKSDLFGILQNMIIRFGYDQLLIKSMAAFFLKSKEDPTTFLEFVKFDEKVLEEIEKNLHAKLREAKDHIEHCSFGANKIADKMRELNFDGIVDMFGSLTPLNREKRDLIRIAMKNVHKSYGSEEGLINATYNFAICRTTIRALQDVLDNPLLASASPKTVRIFEDGEKKFVMKEELFNAIGQKVEEQDDRFLSTMSEKEVEAQFGNLIKNIEFIRYPIVRAEHKAVPIQHPTGFCQLAIDTFFETLKSFIFEAKIFQTNAEAARDFIEVSYLHGGFDPEEVNLYFYKQPDAKGKQLVNIGNVHGTVKPKDVRNAKKDGFTAQNLRNELANLGLLKAFPEIQERADVVYSEVVEKKKGPILRTCDLYTAVEHCQLLCILERAPKLKKFLHNQKGCSRVYGYQCEYCAKIQKALEIQKNDKIIEDLEGELSLLQLEHQKILEQIQQKSEKLKEKKLENKELKK